VTTTTTTLRMTAAQLRLQMLAAGVEVGLPVPEAAAMAGVSRSTFYLRAQAAGILRKVGRRTVIFPSDVRSLMRAEPKGVA
jgi:hypothetical protein